MSEPEHPPVEVARFPRLSDARTASLALAARDVAYWILRDGDDWVLKVEASVQIIASEELARFAAEEREQPAAPETTPEGRLQTGSLFVAGWILCGFFLLQEMLPEWWRDAGVADNRAILSGEWWRMFTALTLHGELPHLIANLGTGLLFAAFLIPQLGTGVTWMAVVLAGALGNGINALGYRGETHLSVGASTAVFAALGLLVGGELCAKLRHAHTRSRWHLVVPLGAGLALLAYLGVGETIDPVTGASRDTRVDFMAHLWGFAVGLPLGMILAAVRIRERAPRWLRIGCGLGALALLVAAWALAVG